MVLAYSDFFLSLHALNYLLAGMFDIHPPYLLYPSTERTEAWLVEAVQRLSKP